MTQSPKLSLLSPRILLVFYIIADITHFKSKNTLGAYYDRNDKKVEDNLEENLIATGTICFLTVSKSTTMMVSFL